MCVSFATFANNDDDEKKKTKPVISLIGALQKDNSCNIIMASLVTQETHHQLAQLGNRQNLYEAILTYNSTDPYFWQNLTHCLALWTSSVLGLDYPQNPLFAAETTFNPEAYDSMETTSSLPSTVAPPDYLETANQSASYDYPSLSITAFNRCAQSLLPKSAYQVSPESFIAG